MKSEKQKKLFPEKKFLNRNFRPVYTLSETDRFSEAFITNVKYKLLGEGLEENAKAFINRAYKAETYQEILKIASEYLDIRGVPAQPKNDSTPDLFTKKEKKKKSFELKADSAPLNLFGSKKDKK